MYPITYFADSQGFLFPQNEPLAPRNPDPQWNSLVLTTCAPPLPRFDDFDVLYQHTYEFRKHVFSLQNARAVEDATDLFRDAKGRTRIVFGLQRAPRHLTFERLCLLRRLGVVSMALAYSKASDYGGGFETDLGLTEKGADLVREMSRANIAADLSHASHHLARDILELLESERLKMLPIATHSGCHAVFDHPRNLPDDVLEGVASLGGYIGIPLFGPLIALEGTSVWHYAGEHLRHALTVCGEETVGIGSDCQHFDMTYAEAEKLFTDLVAMVKPTGPVYFPDRPQEIIEHGSEMSKYIDKNLCQRFPEGVGRGIAGRNFRSYLARQI